MPDAASADAGIKDRSVYGAIVLAPHGVIMHVASAGSPAVAALLTQAAADPGPAPVVDVVPNDPDDPQGAGLGTAFLPLAITELPALAPAVGSRRALSADRIRRDAAARSVAYFGGSGATPEAAVLIAYAIGGLALWAGRRGLSPHRAPVAEPEHEAVLVE